MFDSKFNRTKVLQFIFSSRLKEIDAFSHDAKNLQNSVLHRLIRSAENTEWGQLHKYKDIKDYDTFRKQVPISTYDDLKPYIERMMEGEQNLLWGSEVTSFAKSSGTTSDKSKFIPVSKEALEDTHYRGGKDAVALYLRNNPESDFISGKGVILGGSHAPHLSNEHALVGDLSAILLENISPLINILRCPSKEIALMDEWEAKIEAIATSTMDVNVTNLSGVPSWMLVLIKDIMRRKGVDNLADVWPNLEVFFHGGVAFTPYREQYKEIIKSDKMHYVETYNASEGYFATQSTFDDLSMLLMLDYGIFYEFIPLEDLDGDNPQAICVTEVELDKNYALVISTSSGLWRYVIGDTVKFTSKAPYKIQITGRTKHFINAFGEELIIDNAEKGLAAACEATGSQVVEYSAAPVFMDANAKCRHQWLIEFKKVPDSLDKFASVLDKTLKEVNSDYEAKRHKDIALQPLEVIVARPGLFHDWMASRGKLGGQHKVPRLSNTRQHIEQMLELNHTR
ncbi:MAG TPA: GH3 auxin-responsive promoter family protein [Bacteroidaceae bacterium]|nr:GH3 auxin-responsive promoter family protein [Bacteroidaceae bacterium]